MAKPRDVDPVKLFMAILWARNDDMNRALEKSIARWGEIDFMSGDYAFDMTDYYEPEMGPGLRRTLIAFVPLVSPECLIEAKHRCNDIEDACATEHGRSVNLDVGYLDHNKIVLASFKGAGQKIYLCNGVWADMIARYRGGRYVPFEWTFPDFKTGRYDQYLLTIRERYLKQLRYHK